jgi:hypothetical protein
MLSKIPSHPSPEAGIPSRPWLTLPKAVFPNTHFKVLVVMLQGGYTLNPLLRNANVSPPT